MAAMVARVSGKRRAEACGERAKDTKPVFCEKALRASMLKARYADTIFKAMMILDRGKSDDHVVTTRMMKNESEIKRAWRREAEDNLKRQFVQREREASRKRLEEMEKSHIDHHTDIHTLAFLKHLDYYSPRLSPLEQFGLYIKKEDDYDSDQD